MNFLNQLKKKIFIFFLLFPLTASAIDVTHIFFQTQDIHTVFFSQKDSVTTDPIVELNSNTILRLQFDELDVDNSRNLYYSFIHCNAQWKPSDLLDIDFCAEFNKFFETDKASFSFNTTVDYIHYELEIDTSPLKISGNYFVCIFDTNTDEMILSRPFMIYEKKQISIKYNINNINGLQTISVLIDPANLKIKSSEEITLVLWQNHNFFDYRVVRKISRIQGNNYIYDDISFKGGNEYRWFDNSDLKRNGTHVHDVLFEDPFFHITLDEDEKQPRTYKYHGDINGKHYIKTQNSTYNPTIGADYTIVHFTLKSNDGFVGNVFISGDLTNVFFSDYNKMNFDPFNKKYSQSIWVKQGLHNYQYLTYNDATLSNDPFEGNFSETDNQYNLAIYYHPFECRYDRLILFEQFDSTTKKNNFF